MPCSGNSGKKRERKMPKTRLNLHNIMIHKNISRMGNVAHGSAFGDVRILWLEFEEEMKNAG
jgi:hypothetical protein